MKQKRHFLSIACVVLALASSAASAASVSGSWGSYGPQAGYSYYNYNEVTTNGAPGPVSAITTAQNQARDRMFPLDIWGSTPASFETMVRWSGTQAPTTTLVLRSATRSRQATSPISVRLPTPKDKLMHKTETATTRTRLSRVQTLSETHRERETRNA